MSALVDPRYDSAGNDPLIIQCYVDLDVLLLDDAGAGPVT